MVPKSERTRPSGVEEDEVSKAEGTASATISTVERAADVLLHLASRPGQDLGVTQIAETLALPKAAVHRVLASLRTRELVELDEQTHRYRLGVAAMRLGMAYVDGIDVRAMARPHLMDLCRATNETATLSVPLGNRARIYVDQVLPDREVLMSVTLGDPYPLHAGASSRVLLAFQSPEELDAYLALPELDRLTANTVVDREALRAELHEVRDKGWAMSVAERQEGAASVAAPVRDHTGRAIAVVSVCGPGERFVESIEIYRDALLSVAAQLSRRTGWLD